MSDSPPTYDELAEHLRNNPSEVAKIYEAIAKETNSDETRAKLKDEVNKLAGASKQISDSFNKVSIVLAEVDRNEYKEDDGVTPVQKLKPGWDSLQNRWDQVYLRSRKSASDTIWYAERMLKLIIPMLSKSEDDVPLSEKQEVLDSFITHERPSTVNSIQDATNIANNHSAEFKQLATDVRNYKTKFDHFAESQRIIFQKQINDLKSTLAKLEKDLQEQERTVHNASVVLGLTVFGTAAGALAALAILGPAGIGTVVGILISGLINSGVQTANLVKQVKTYNAIRDQRDATKTALDKATADLKELLRLRGLLESTKGELDGIAARLDQFSNVWSMIAHDASIIANDLKLAKEVPTTAEFKQKIELIEACYTALIEALNAYVEVTK